MDAIKYKTHKKMPLVPIFSVPYLNRNQEAMVSFALDPPLTEIFILYSKASSDITIVITNRTTTFHNKEFIFVTSAVGTSLDSHCSTFGDYEPAYLNYMEEYHM